MFPSNDNGRLWHKMEYFGRFLLFNARDLGTRETTFVPMFWRYAQVKAQFSVCVLDEEFENYELRYKFNISLQKRHVRFKLKFVTPPISGQHFSPPRSHTDLSAQYSVTERRLSPRSASRSHSAYKVARWDQSGPKGEDISPRFLFF